MADSVTVWLGASTYVAVIPKGGPAVASATYDDARLVYDDNQPYDGVDAAASLTYWLPPSSVTVIVEA